jgi:hypothetical protein
VIFDGITDENYPVYNTNSLLNSNQNYDYGEFFQLGKKIKAGDFKGANSITSFVTSFDKAGIYVF